jgi:hypothetical protein
MLFKRPGRVLLPIFIAALVGSGGHLACTGWDGSESSPTVAPAPGGGFSPGAGGGGLSPPAGNPPGGTTGAADPCMGESTEGSCGPNGAQKCVIPTGDGTPTLVKDVCTSYEECTITPQGAACTPKMGACDPGASQCLGADTILVCPPTAQWQMLPCPGGCLKTALGDFCRLKVETVPYTATIKYEARSVNANLTDWSASTFIAPAQGMVVAVFRGDDIIDADITTAEGKFAVTIPTQLQPNDQIIVLLVHPTEAKTGLAIAIGRPDVKDGMQDQHEAASGKPAIWQWSIDPRANPTGSELTIRESDGSGAVRLFDNLRKVYADTKGLLRTEGHPLVVWLRMNTAWKCGACMFEDPVRVGPITFISQVAIPALRENTSYWSDAVTAHELFHWVMRSYGVSPGEGGRHCAGVPTMPGMAWSEGFATGFSSIIRNSPLNYDKQGGTFFWYDIAQRKYARGAWMRPRAGDGLEQIIDENEIAAMLYALSKDPAVGLDRMLVALSSPRMTERPFLRGYFTHRFMAGPDCRPANVMKTMYSAPYLADFLDALRCSGVPAASIDAVTEPATHYPYPSASPLCR